MTPVELSRTVLHAVRRAVDEGELSVAVPERVVVSEPGPGGCGDYATSIALQLARPAGQPPLRVAEILRPRLVGVDGILDVVVTGPGFLNFRLDERADPVTGLVREILARGAEYGYGDALAGQVVALRVPYEVRAEVVADAVVRIVGTQGGRATVEHREPVNLRPVPAPEDPAPLGPDAAQWALLHPAAHDRPRITADHLVQRESNPLFRVRYAHARIRSLSRNAARLGFCAEPGPVTQPTPEDAGQPTPEDVGQLTHPHATRSPGGLTCPTPSAPEDAGQLAHPHATRSPGRLTCPTPSAPEYAGLLAHPHATRNAGLHAHPTPSAPEDAGPVNAGTSADFADFAESTGTADTGTNRTRNTPPVTPSTPPVTPSTPLPGQTPATPPVSPVLAGPADGAVPLPGQPRTPPASAHLAGMLGTVAVGDSARPLLTALTAHPRILAAAATHRAPDRLARHLVTLADAVLPFLPCVLPCGEEKPSAAHRARLALAEAAGTVLAGGLSLLGIDAPEHL